MTIVNDETVFNDASSQGDWTAQDFDSPTDNDTNASPSIYREGAVCQQWILKENITDGYTYTSTIGGPIDISNGEAVIFWFFITADADLDKLTKMRLRLSSDTGFTTNYAEWDVADQIYGLDYYGWFPIIVYPTNPVATAGTIDYSSIDSIGWVCSTGAAGTKLSGFDQCHSVKYLGGHSQTVTLENLYDNSIANDLGVVLKFGDFYKFQASILLGGGTTANATINEPDKSVLFDNKQPEQELGFIFNDNTSGLNIFELNGWNVSWNSQLSTHDIFKNANNCDTFKVDGSVFTRGGRSVLPSYSLTRWVKNSKFAGCHPVDLGDCIYEDNIISGQVLGSIYKGSTATRRVKRTVYINNTTATEFDTVGNYTLDGDTFSGNTYDIENSGNAATITAGFFVVGRAYKILVPGTTIFTAIGAADNNIGTKFVATGVGTGNGTATEVLLVNATNGANPSIAKINNTGTNADTLLQNAVTLKVKVQNKAKSPIQDAQSSMMLTDGTRILLMNEDTLATGIAEESYNYGGTPFEVVVKVRKSEDTDNPRYFSFSDVQQVDANGLFLTVTLEENPFI